MNAVEDYSKFDETHFDFCGLFGEVFDVEYILIGLFDC
jgi:hypothetical protein